MTDDNIKSDVGIYEIQKRINNARYEKQNYRFLREI